MGTELSGGKSPPDSHAEGRLAYGKEFVAGPVAGSLKLCSISQLFCQGEPPLGTGPHVRPAQHSISSGIPQPALGKDGAGKQVQVSEEQ